MLSPMERVNELVGLLDLNPSIEQIAKFLKHSVDPQGEVCGVTIHELDSLGVIHANFALGFKVELDLSQTVSISDDNPMCVALITGKVQIVNLIPKELQFREIPQLDRLTDYQTGIALPLTNEILITLAFVSRQSDVELQREYFEVIQTLLSSYMKKSNFGKKKQSHMRKEESPKLTARQSSILEMIKEGRTNISIATILGYSESLIRQETIVIYKKLGVEGRRDLLRESNIEEHSE